MRHDLAALIGAAIRAADPSRLVRRALGNPDILDILQHASAVDVIAAGKAAAPMVSACAAHVTQPIRSTLLAGPASATADRLPAGAERHHGGHPLPDERSVLAAERALEVTRTARDEDVLIALLSGGASSMFALPAEGISLEDKRHTIETLLRCGANIHELNAVRKHLSAVKGGRLAAAHRGWTLTLAMSDVVDDDLSVIGSGPTVADPTTFEDALDVLDRIGGRLAYPERVADLLCRGAAGDLDETMKPGDARLARSRAFVVGGRRDALEGARHEAEARGFSVRIVEQPVVGEAREAARAHAARVAELLAGVARPACVLSGGETTVRVRGRGAGGRNQEFALAFAQELERFGTHVVAASFGTDGIDGPTDAAGAVVDSSTLARARQAGLGDPDKYLKDNNSFAFFSSLDDLIRTGPTSTNVGDVQVVLIGE